MTGTAEHIRATVRHGSNVFIAKIVNIPIDAQMNVYPIKTPRVDGSLVL